MNCPNCNKQLNPNQKFCDSCGFAIVPDPLNAKNTQRIFDTPNNNAPDAPGYGSGVYPSYQAAPAQPQYQEPYYAQPQPYGGGPQPPEKKNNMPLIIIIIVLAVLLAAGGIVTAILLLNNRGDKGSDPSSSAATSSKVSDSGSSKRDSDPSGDESSSKRESGSRESSESSKSENLESSWRESSSYSSREISSSRSESSRVSNAKHYIINDDGIILADDNSIDANDYAAQAKIEKFMRENGADEIVKNTSVEGEAEVKIYAKGNTLVLDEKILREITDEEEKEIVSAFNIMAQNSDIKTPRSKTGVDNLCVVFAVVSKDGKVIYSKVIS